MTHDEYVISGVLRRVVVVTRGGPGSGFKGHRGRPGKVGGSLPGSLHGFKPGEFKEKPDLLREAMPELGKNISIVYSGRPGKPQWIAKLQHALEQFRSATGVAPQGLTITDSLPYVFWEMAPFDVRLNMPKADAEEIKAELERSPWNHAFGAYYLSPHPTIYLEPERVHSPEFGETVGHELGHWLTMTAAPGTWETVSPSRDFDMETALLYPRAIQQREYAAGLVESAMRPRDLTWSWIRGHTAFTEEEQTHRQILMEEVRRSLVLRSGPDAPPLMVLVLMGDEIVAVPEAELDDLPKGAIINPLYLWWKEHFQPKVELDLDAKAFGWEAEDIAVQGEPEDGIFAVVEEVQRPKGRKETMAEAARQEPAPVPPEGESPSEAPAEDEVDSAFDTIMRGTPTTPSEVQGAEPRGLSLSDFGGLFTGLFTRFVDVLEKVRVPVVHVDVAPADIHFHAPEQPAPIVNLTLPDSASAPTPNIIVQPAPVTVIQTPMAKLLRRRGIHRLTRDGGKGVVTGNEVEEEYEYEGDGDVQQGQ